MPNVGAVPATNSEPSSAAAAFGGSRSAVLPHQATQAAEAQARTPTASAAVPPQPVMPAAGASEQAAGLKGRAASAAAAQEAVRDVPAGAIKSKTATAVFTAAPGKKGPPAAAARRRRTLAPALATVAPAAARGPNAATIADTATAAPAAGLGSTAESADKPQQQSNAMSQRGDSRTYFMAGVPGSRSERVNVRMTVMHVTHMTVFPQSGNSEMTGMMDTCRSTTGTQTQLFTRDRVD